MKHAFKRIAAMLLVAAMLLGVLPTAFAANVGPFADVQDTEWFAEYVEYAYDNGYMAGVSNNRFDPQGICTRAMVATVLWRVAGEPPVANPAPFTDLTADWYANAIAWAYKNNVVAGVSADKFAPDQAATREQLVALFWRYVGKPAAKGDISKFADNAKVSDYAKEAFAWAVGKGIIAGDNGNLRPQDDATRAEFACIIYSFVEAMKPCEEHTWDEGVVTKAATCTEEGEKTFTCTRCDLVKSEAIPTLGHSYVDGVCGTCGDKLASEDEIVIYFTNDVHTYIDKALSYDNIADLKAQTAKIAAGTLLVDAGDHIQGTAYGSMDKGASIISLMNAAGYDLATLGNHEFDYDMPRVLEIVGTPEKEGMADFPYVSANFYHEKDGVRGETVLDAYKLFTVGGKKIAIIGVTTPETFTKSTPKYFMNEAGEYIYGIAGGDDGAALYADVQAAIDAAKKENPDFIIALAHLGDDPASKPWTSEEVIANVTGLDALIDGHSHSTVVGKNVKDKDGNDVILAQTGQYFDAIGRMSIKGEEIAVELITEYTGSDATVAEIKNAWMAEVDTKLGEVIAKNEVDFRISDDNGTRLIRKQETNLGDFAADALYYLFDVTEGLGADLAIMNGGGIRANMPAGDVSYKTTKTVHTFGNVACLIEVTGQQILDALEWGAKNVGVGENGGFLHVSGVTYEIHSYIPSTVQADDKAVWIGGPTGEYRVKNVTIGGEPLDLTKTYKMAGYNYTLRDLGDGFAMFSGATNVKDYVMEDYMVLANYAKNFPEATIKADNSPLGANYGDINGEGRITIVTEKPIVPEGDAYGLSSTIKEGDEVIIVCAAKNMALSTLYGGWYNSAIPVEPANGIIYTDDPALVWTVGVEGDYYTFSYDGQKIGMDVEKTSMPLGAVNDTWQVMPAKTAGASYIYNVGRQAYMEYYEEKGTWSGYYNNSNEELFALNFYVKGATPEQGGDEPTPPTPPTPPVPGNEFAKVSSIKAGDEVIIVCESRNIALGADYAGSFYNPGVAVTPVDGKITTDDATIVWTVGTEGEFYTFSYNGQKIAMGTGYTSMPLGEVNYKWQIEAAQTAGSFYVKNLDRDPTQAYYMQWYEAKNYWSGYYNLNDELMALSFYVKGATPEQGGDEPTPPTPPTPPVPGNEFAKVSSIKAGDEVIIVCESRNIALGADYAGSFYNPGVAVTPVDGKITTDDATIVWTVGTEGEFYTFSYNGQKIAMGTGYTSMPLGEVNYKWQLEAAATEGSFYVKNLDRDPAQAYYMQWYEAKNYWSGYYKLNDELMALSFYVKGATPETPDTPDQPDTPDEPDTPDTPVVPTEGYVAIYNVANAKVMTTETTPYTDKYGNVKEQAVSAAATLADGKLTVTADNVALFKMVTEDGITTFQMEDGRYLEADGTNIRFVKEATPNTEFVLEETEGGYFIRLANYVYTNTADGSTKPQYIEFYKDIFTTYGMGADLTQFTFAFYELAEAGETPDQPDEPDTPVEPEEPTEPKEGYVAIYNVANAKVMTTETTPYTDKYGNVKEQAVSAAATLADGKLTVTASNVALFKMVTEDGITTFQMEDGRYLEADGTNIRFVKEATPNTEFVLEETEGGYFIRLLNYVYTNTADGSTKPQYIEFYKDIFTTYGMGEASMYIFNFYELAEAGETPDEPTEPDTPDTPDEPVTPPVAGELANGKYVIAAYVDGKYYAMSNTFGKKINGEEIAVSNGTVSAANAAKYAVTLTASGNAWTIYGAEAYLTYASGTDLGTSADPYLWTITRSVNADGLWNITSVDTPARGILFQLGTGYRFGGYSMSNVGKADYAEVVLLPVV